MLKTNISFSEALVALKEGQSISRTGWNGKKMFLWLNRGSHDFRTDVEVDYVEGIKDDLFDDAAEGTTTRLPNINMRTATGSTVTGWLASQTDLLAEDWCVLDDSEIS